MKTAEDSLDCTLSVGEVAAVQKLVLATNRTLQRGVAKQRLASRGPLVGQDAHRAALLEALFQAFAARWVKSHT